MISRFSLVALLILCFGCSRVKLKNPTDDFSEARRVVKLLNPTLGEISGIVASVNNPGNFWVHNDSGDEPRIFLVDIKLKVLLTVSLQDATNRDWEDIAVGPGPDKGKNYLYIGEIGDNSANYEYKAIYRLEEPTYDGTAELSMKADQINFRLEGKKKDTETLLVDPVTKDIYVVSKREEPVWLYKLPYPQSLKDTLEAKKTMSLPFTQIVGGDISPDGKKILLKNYEHIYYWSVDDRNKTIEEILAERPREVKYEMEPQGEAIAWARDESGFFTLSEKNVGKETYLYFYQAKNHSNTATGN